MFKLKKKKCLKINLFRIIIIFLGLALFRKCTVLKYSQYLKIFDFERLIFRTFFVVHSERILSKYYSGFPSEKPGHDLLLLFCF